MKAIYALFLLLFAPALVFADLKVTTKNTAGGQVSESTIHIKGQRQRTEGRGFVSIYQCDLRRLIQLNDRTRKYLVMRLDGDAGGDATAGTSTSTSSSTAMSRVMTTDGQMVLQSAETAVGDNEAASISAALQQEARAVVAAVLNRN